jgi:hypothetical protein
MDWEIWKDDDDLAKEIMSLIETVKRFWHYLENKYLDLPSIYTPKNSIKY